MNLVLFHPGEYGAAERVARLPKGDARAEHLFKVLHVREGQAFRAGVANGASGLARIEGEEGACWRIRCAFDRPAEARPRVDILLAMPRPKALPRILEDLAALSFGTLWLFAASKTRGAYGTSHKAEAAAVEAAVWAGLQQGRHTRVPEVRTLEGLSLGALPLAEYAARLVAHPTEEASLPLLQSLRGLPAAARVLLAIGPEPGWTDGELKRLFCRHFLPFSLGPAPLRTHAAAVALLSALQLHLG